MLIRVLLLKVMMIISIVGVYKSSINESNNRKYVGIVSSYLDGNTGFYACYFSLFLGSPQPIIRKINENQICQTNYHHLSSQITHIQRLPLLTGGQIPD